MQQLILILHVLIAISLITLILLQHGKGADAGASFGGGSSNTMFGSIGPAPFLMKVTAILAALFFSTSLFLVYLVKQDLQQAIQFNTPTTNHPTLPVAPSSNRPQQDKLNIKE